MDKVGSAKITLPSPSKINLYLHIVGRRADGYHHLETAMQFIDFNDSITFTLAAEISRSDHHNFKLPKQDLCMRAARLLKQKFATAAGVNIKLTKRIPPGSGLGGGSSNAATTLLGLNKLWGLNLSRDELMNIAAELGADIPFFVGGVAAVASGIGEKLTPTNFANKYICLAIAPVEISTPAVFAEYDKGGESSAGNDLESAAVKLYPQVGKLLKAMRAHGDAHMSGSGGAVFAICESRAAAEDLSKKISQPAMVVATMNQSRLLECIE